jgi:hypothetical protein
MFLYALMLTNIKIKIDKNVILLLEKDLLFLKLNGRVILDFGNIFPKYDKILCKIYQIYKINYMKRFDFYYFDILSFF